MRLVLLTSITMIAFAANSVLNRMAVDGGHIDASSFAVLRVLSGAGMLALILAVKGGKLRLFTQDRIVGAVSLAVYMIGFSLAYVALDAGLGALILFGTVQVTMFVWSFFSDTRPSARVLLGAGIAFGGLVVALWPDPEAAFGLSAALFMVCAGLGWAAYTMRGRGAKDPLAETTANFAVALVPMGVLLFGLDMWADPTGIVLAVISGAVTSGMGYALWYSIIPQLGANRAAVVQLSVPIIAIAGGVFLLGEQLTAQVMLAAVLVLGGIFLAVSEQGSQADRK